jgi:CheY-like chemotaxis protein
VAPFDASLSVEGDLVRLTQVLSNLLDNAAKFTPDRGEIWLSVRREDAEVQIVVQDNGRGIAPEALAHVFDFFAPTDRADLHADGGLGVGLGLVRRLVELHGGHIRARSEGVGRGAQFILTLPLASGVAAEQAQTAPVAQDAPVVQTSARPPAPHRVLVVDDNVDSATSLTMLLQTMGFEAESAHDGVEALEAVERLAPDTVLLDIGLPRLNGYEVARRLRERGGRRELLIALTGWGQVEDRERSRAAGFDHHLVKPVDLEQLARILQAPPQAAAQATPPA